MSVQIQSGFSSREPGVANYLFGKGKFKEELPFSANVVIATDGIGIFGAAVINKGKVFVHADDKNLCRRLRQTIKKI
jgi:hypothetical protein